MIPLVNIVGAQCNDPHAPHGQRPQVCGPTQCIYHGSVKHNDPAALTLSARGPTLILTSKVGPRTERIKNV